MHASLLESFYSSFPCPTTSLFFNNMLIYAHYKCLEAPWTSLCVYFTQAEGGIQSL